MTFKSNLEADAIDTFLDATEFAESIDYYPSANLGDKRTFNAIVVRGEVNTLQNLDAGDALALEATVTIANTSDQTKGIDTVDKGSDLLDIVIREDTPAVRCRVVRILRADAGMYVLGVVGGATL